MFSFVVQEWVEAGVLLFIILFNAVIGFAQEYSSERTLDALRRLAASFAVVVRDGCQQRISASDVVVGIRC